MSTLTEILSWRGDTWRVGDAVYDRHGHHRRSGVVVDFVSASLAIVDWPGGPKVERLVDLLNGRHGGTRL